MMKSKITNTTENVQLGWLFGINPDAIEAQETKGQKELVNSSQLPIKISHGSQKINIKEQYEKMGIEVIKESDGDNLFYDVILPQGWELKSTDHSMWNNLIDNKGRKRASIFYKAAFYDRDAFINFNSRFNIRVEDLTTYEPSLNSYERIAKEKMVGKVYDGDKVIFESKPKMYTVKYESKWKDKDINKHYEWWENYEKMKDDVRKKAKKWLIKKYPKYEDVNSYWD